MTPNHLPYRMSHGATHLTAQTAFHTCFAQYAAACNPAVAGFVTMHVRFFIPLLRLPRRTTHCCAALTGVAVSPPSTTLFPCRYHPMLYCLFISCLHTPCLRTCHLDFTPSAPTASHLPNYHLPTLIIAFPSVQVLPGHDLITRTCSPPPAFLRHRTLWLILPTMHYTYHSW